MEVVPAHWLFGAGVVCGTVFGAVLWVLGSELLRDARERRRFKEWKRWSRRWDEPEDDGGEP